MKLVFNNTVLCELDTCVCGYAGDEHCKNCKYCLDSLYHAELETDQMLKNEPYYLDGDGNLKKIAI